MRLTSNVTRSVKTFVFCNSFEINDLYELRNTVSRKKNEVLRRKAICTNDLTQNVTP